MSEDSEREPPERIPKEMHTGEFDIANRDPKKINKDVVTVQINCFFFIGKKTAETSVQ